MFDTKFLITLIAMIISIVAICNFNIKKEEPVIEKFWNSGARGVKNEVYAVYPNGQMTDVPATQTLLAARNSARSSGLPAGAAFSSEGFTAGQKNGASSSNSGFMPRQTDLPMFQNPAFQSLLSPRTFGGDYGADITYNLPARENLAVPVNPLGYANMARENYSHENFNCNKGCGKTPATCGPGGAGVTNTFNSGQTISMPPYAFPTSSTGDVALGGSERVEAVPVNLPMGTMDASSGDSGDGPDGGQPILFTRSIFATQKSRTRGLGDMIRGDLAIVPNCTGWFQASANPNQDLNQGALFSIGGMDNTTSKDMAALLNLGSLSGQPIAGMNLSNQELVSVGATPQTDVMTTAFP